MPRIKIRDLAAKDEGMADGMAAMHQSHADAHRAAGSSVGFTSIKGGLHAQAWHEHLGAMQEWAAGNHEAAMQATHRAFGATRSAYEG